MKLLVATLAIASISTPSSAGWPTDPSENLPICTNLFLHSFPDIVPDGFGGAIVVWEDYRSGSASHDIFAQRVSAQGSVLWAVNGVPVVTAINSQTLPRAVADGQGGAVVVWIHGEAGPNWDLYAQKLTSGGAIAWQQNGVVVCDAPGVQSDFDLVATDDGGSVIAWTDQRDGLTGDVYAQRLTSDGSPSWADNGALLSDAEGEKVSPKIAFANGFVVAWTNDDGVAPPDIHAQKLDAMGTRLWSSDGVAVCVAAGLQAGAAIVPLAANDVVIAWADERSDPQYGDIYAQRLDADGAAVWVANGVAVCTANNRQGSIVAMPMGGETALLCWVDNRNGRSDLFANRLGPNGDLLWGTTGVPICSGPNGSWEPKIASDGSGGAIITWSDDRDDLFTPDIYAQRVGPSGNVLWSANGVLVSNAPLDQQHPVLVADESGGAIIAWEDWREGGLEAQRYKIFAQRLGPDGSLGIPTSVGPPMPSLGLDISPNPFSRETVLHLVLDRPSSVRIDVFDVTGERVMTRSLPQFTAGTHQIPFVAIDRQGRSLASGVYLCRVSSSSGTKVAKLVIAR